jgi:hypothetical protein
MKVRAITALALGETLVYHAREAQGFCAGRLR